jgi:hypothetical protein
MQIQNLLIYSSAIAVSNDGPWIDISNLVSLSVQINSYSAGSTDIEVSNDPNVMIDGAGIGAPGSAPTLAQTAGGATFQSGVSMLPAVTYFVKTTYITKWGETTASAEASLAVSAGNALIVRTAAPSVAQAPFVTGWNVYVSLSTGTEVLQTAPPYSPQRLIDGIGTVGGTVTSLGPGQSTHFAISGALPISNPNFTLINGFQNTGFTPPGVDASGGTASGVSVSNGAGVDTLSGDNTTVAVMKSGGNLMWTPSCMTWKFLRVTNGGASTLAWINGQRG